MARYNNHKIKYVRLPFGAGHVDDMFQRKLDKMFKEFQNVF